jgi:hypothetical protein
VTEGRQIVRRDYGNIAFRSAVFLTAMRDSSGSEIVTLCPSKQKMVAAFETRGKLKIEIENCDTQELVCDGNFLFPLGTEPFKKFFFQFRIESFSSASYLE